MGQESRPTLAEGRARGDDVIDEDHGGALQSRIGLDRERVQDVKPPFSSSQIGLGTGIPGSHQTVRDEPRAGFPESGGYEPGLIESPMAKPVRVQRHGDDQIGALKNLPAPAILEQPDGQALRSFVPAVVFESDHAVAQGPAIEPERRAP